MDEDLLRLDGRVFSSKRFGPSEQIPRMILDSPRTVCVACVIFVCFA